MIRLLGFLIGSAVSIGILLLILGIPEIQISKNAIENADLDAVSKTVEAAKTDIEAVANEVLADVSEIVDDLATNEPASELPVINEIEEPDPIRERLTLDDWRNENDSLLTESITQTANENIRNDTLNNTTSDLGEPDLKWHSFWNPFRSEIAAIGFVTQLEKVTGLDYRVVKIKTGVYEVTFAYENDTERRTKLSQIASATGLDLPDS